MRSIAIAFVAALLTSPALAAVSCNVSAADNFIATYDSLATSDALSSGTFTVTCTRTASADPTSVSFTANTNNGLNATGGNNRAKQGTANYIKYDFYTAATYATNWSTQSSKAITGTVTMGSGVPASASTVATYYSKLPFGQASPQGIYTDTVGILLTYGTTNTSAPQANMSVQITNIPGCTFSTPPGAISFTYSAFSATAKTASTTFGALCSTSLAYTMSLDSTAGVVAGLRYTLALSGASGTGTGATQTYTINGTMDAGQAGTCTSSTCTASRTHTLTISY
jgi:spore coat protein U-like protein